MSMLSSQIDELRKMADGQATYRDAREVMLKAADTITELRGALQVASVDYRHLQSENDRLRELVRDMWDFFCVVPDDEPHAYKEELDFSIEVWKRMLELGIEVDG